MAAALREEFAALEAYAPPAETRGDALDANENPLPPPARWREAARGILEQASVHRYPDPRAAGLRSRLAALHGLPGDALLFGNGSDELIGLLLAAFGGPEALCLVPDPTFSMYRICALAQGWRVEEIPLGPDWELGGSFVDAARRLRPTLVFLDSPNNPTGAAFDPAVVDSLRGLEGTTLVVDEAYVEFGGRSLLAAAPREEGLVVLRTFSKAWGLAGLRLGWLAAHPRLVVGLEKARLPYNVGALTQALGCAALDLAPEFLGRVPGLLAHRTRLSAALAGVPGLRQWRSDANFILCSHPDAAALHGHLLQRGLRARRFEGGRLSGCLRISVGDAGQTLRLEEALGSFVPAARP